MNILNRSFAAAFFITSLWLSPHVAQAYQMPTFPIEPTNVPLDSWSFNDPNGWTSDYGYAPVSFTNLNFSNLGDGQSLVVDTNVPAWLQYNVFENDGTTNLTVQTGTVFFWFAPNWSSADDTNGGSGPGEYGRLFEVGGYTTNSSYGWWSLYVDPLGENIYFGSQTNDGLGDTYVLSAPIDWTTNYFHFVALTYSPTNVSLYLDGVLATNDPGGLNIWPGTDVLSNGFWMGSDSNGIYQAHGLLNDVETFDYPLDSDDIVTNYNWAQFDYVLNPYNAAYELLTSAPSDPSTNYTVPNVITGSGYLQWDGNASGCTYSTNANTVWLTNIVVTPVGVGTMNVTFSINGGESGYWYDVFATSALEKPITNSTWAWMGQGQACNTYTITNLVSTTAFLILGTPDDPENNNLTAAYSVLMLGLDPYIYDQDGSGLSDGYQVLLGLSALTNQVAQPGTSSIYSYTSADWIEGVSGIRTGSVTMDNEGNVRTVSQ